MPILSGLDEAGYGPALGPLAVGLAVFDVPDALLAADLWDSLAPAISRAPAGDDPEAPVAVADSKKIYGGARGLDRLARAVSAFRFAGASGGTRVLGSPYWGALPPVPDPAPDPAAERLRARIEALGIRPRFLGAVLLSEEEFNARLARLHSKGVVLSELGGAFVGETLGRIAEGSELSSSRGGPRDGGSAEGREPSRPCHPSPEKTSASPPPGPGRFLFDRQGGRKDYAGFLLRAFPGTMWRRAASRGRDPDARILYRSDLGAAEFVVKGDALELPVALASMAAKFARERAMERLNAFWAARAPGLAPTAGYPEDARRFLRDIEPARAKAGIPMEAVRRMK